VQKKKKHHKNHQNNTRTKDKRKKKNEKWVKLNQNLGHNKCLYPKLKRKGNKIPYELE